MEKIIVLAFLMLCSRPALAIDHRSQIGVGGALGGTTAAPWASPAFRNAVSVGAPAVGAWVRYIPGTPEIGTELSYNYFRLGKMNLNSHTLVLSFISRQNPWGKFHPFYAFGIGYAKSFNKFAGGDAGTQEDPVYKITAGLDFELDEHTDFGFQLNHYSIFKDKATEQNIHVISPVFTMNYYFGTAAPLPPVTAPTPVPAPAAAAAPAPAVPVPVREEIQPVPAQSSSSVKGNSSSKSKKKAQKKKRRKTMSPAITEEAQ